MKPRNPMSRAPRLFSEQGVIISDLRKASIAGIDNRTCRVDDQPRLAGLFQDARFHRGRQHGRRLPFVPRPQALEAIGEESPAAIRKTSDTVPLSRAI